MRRSRRGGGSGVEFGSSGEDSFVAVVVTKLTGALLFILLLTMVIMALLPKVADLEERKQHRVAIRRARRAGVRSRSRRPAGFPRRSPAGRTWWRSRRPAAAGRRNGRPRADCPTGSPSIANPAGSAVRRQAQTKEPLAFEIRVSDGTETASLAAQLVVLPYQSESVRAWKRLVNGVPWRAWLEQGVGFLVLWLVHLVGMNLLANAERGSLAEIAGFRERRMAIQVTVRKRFASYRLVVRLASLAAMLALLGWLLVGRPRCSSVECNLTPSMIAIITACVDVGIVHSHGLLDMHASMVRAFICVSIMQFVFFWKVVRP